MADYILRLEAVSKRFDHTVTAHELSLSVGRGEFFTLLGPSGSGKSTLLRIVAGLERPDAGRVFLDGADVSGWPPWKRNLGMVFQHYSLFPHMTVAQNVAYGLRARHEPREKIGPRVDGLLKLVGLTGVGGKSAVLLSGGEQQRVALARALAPSPKLLLLDEPLSALDEKIRRDMQNELKSIQRQTGTTFLYVTHDQEEALTMSDRIAVLNQGVCVQCDTPLQLFSHPRTRFVGRFFRGCNVLDAQYVGIQGDLMRVRLAGREFLANRDSLAASAGAVLGIAIRSEHVTLDMPATGEGVNFSGTVQEVTYRGASVDYRIALADGQSLVATSSRQEALVPGQAVTASVARDHVVLLEEEPEATAPSGHPAETE
ncbi:MAG TPA: ABC transporter ATP-binding protein [bacterium]|nr:ABC transporter ATP-binding protein [bacterium]